MIVFYFLVLSFALFSDGLDGEEVKRFKSIFE